MEPSANLANIKTLVRFVGNRKTFVTDIFSQVLKMVEMTCFLIYLNKNILGFADSNKALL